VYKMSREFISKEAIEKLKAEIEQEFEHAKL